MFGLAVCPLAVLVLTGWTPPNLTSEGTARSPGLSWLTMRGSAPALKWQLAQACPSPPTALSQNRALPSTTSQGLLLTNPLNSAWSGTGGCTFSLKSAMVGTGSTGSVT